tara:strand:- start:252 stop:413 length:162 start_codon:yes stop_codon:yes gene_type:complete
MQLSGEVDCRFDGLIFLHILPKKDSGFSVAHVALSEKQIGVRTLLLAFSASYR